MKTMLVLFAVGLVLFVASAAGSLYLKQKEEQVANAAHAKDETKVERPHAKIEDLPEPAPLAVRPAANPTPENVVQLAASLKQQQEALKLREEKLQVRQKHLELIQIDLQKERKNLDQVRQQINEEMKGLLEKLDSLEGKSANLNKQSDKLGEQARQVNQSMHEFDKTEQNRIKQMATMYDSMEPDVAADILQQMADDGKLDTAVKILATMRERQAARVLAQFSDRTTVVQLFDRMKGLKRPQETSIRLGTPTNTP